MFGTINLQSFGGENMDYFSVIQTAVDFIEEHLYENISIKDVAREVGFSVPHFYRIFPAVVGETFKSYMSKRRISNGALMLKESDLKICSVAFETGFESHEVFIRSFKRIYGVSPKESKALETLPLYEKIDVMRKKTLLEKGAIILNTKIVVRNSFRITGKTIHLNQAEQVKDSLIDKFFNQFQQEKIKFPTINSESIIYSMYEYDPECIFEDDENINYLYTVGVEWQEGHAIPEGFVQKEIPQSKYALFVYDKEKNTLNGELLSSLKYEGKPITDVYDYIDGVWILNSGYTLSDKPDFEIRNATTKGITEYYISIEDHAN